MSPDGELPLQAQPSSASPALLGLKSWDCAPAADYGNKADVKASASKSGPIQVAIVEDDPHIRASLAGLVGRDPKLRLTASFRDAETALKEIPQHPPQVVLMDINLPKMNGVECVRQLKALLPAVQFVMLTVYEDSDSLFNSLRAGASGYLLKRSASTRLAEAIHEVHKGGSPITPQIARRVVQHFQQIQAPAEPGDELSPHQRAFLEQLAQGYRYKEIADNLGISMDTVRNYVRRIYEKLHVHSRTEAVVKYLKR
jgi:DNA-binding NarL/FixJ family response regulator